MVSLELREHARLGHGVVRQLARDELAVLVVHGFLEQRLGDALRDAAMDLTAAQQRIDDGAAVVHGHEALDLDGPRVLVHLDHRDVRAEGIGQVAGLEAAGGVQARLDVRGRGAGTLPAPVVGREHHLRQRHLAFLVRGHDDLGVFVAHAFRPRIEQARADLLDLVLQLLQRHAQRGASGGHVAAAVGAVAVRCHVRIGVNHAHVLHLHAQLIRRDLREGRLAALPVGRGPGEHRHHARGLDLHGRGFPESHAGGA